LLAGAVVIIAKAIIVLIVAVIVMIITKYLLLKHLVHLQLSIAIDQQQLKEVEGTERVIMRYLQVLHPFGMNNLAVQKKYLMSKIYLLCCCLM
jgi:hypothetical protein